jgi:pimeloyl-ACP methyl ester carboxylesterase
MIEELAKQHQLILFDNRGVGLSTDTEENNTTIPQMADDAAGLLKALGIKKANILAYSMGARIGQQFLIRHPDMVNKAVLAAANPGGSHEDPAAPDVEGKLNNPDTPRMERLALTAPDDPAGKAAVQATIDRIKAAVEAGIMPNDFEVSKQTVERQDRARTTLWRADNSNFEDLKNIKVPVLITDGRSDELDPPKNSLIIANQIPFSWLAYFWGGHSFLYTEPKRFADTVNVFLQ